MTVSITISRLANQFWDSPLSSAICNAPMPRLSRANPSRSKRRLASILVSSIKAASPNQASRPNGRLM
ncbi:hypothetical protein D3C85_1663320 [compost metagenome]